MGVEPETAASFIQDEGADVVALNCGTGMDIERARQAVERYKKVTNLPVMAQPNAGQPRLVDMQVMYDETPDEMVRGVVPLLDAGASIIGACCGSTPAHILAFRRVMDEYLGRSRSECPAEAVS
jgi:5-methyltetrahydrofolate--homocysteine methyltransferase